MAWLKKSRSTMSLLRHRATSWTAVLTATGASPALARAWFTSCTMKSSSAVEKESLAQAPRTGASSRCPVLARELPYHPDLGAAARFEQHDGGLVGHGRDRHRETGLWDQVAGAHLVQEAIERLG